MILTIIENAWTSATRRKPPIGREVLAIFADGHKAVAKWNGFYWVGQHNMRFTQGDSITHYLLFEKFDENDILN